jgi:hypothetical protein
MTYNVLIISILMLPLLVSALILSKRERLVLPADIRTKVTTFVVVKVGCEFARSGRVNGVLPHWAGLVEVICSHICHEVPC